MSNQQEKYGFVYVWHNTRKNKFYVGCHWGREDDGYVCSSKPMRNAYAYDSSIFKRRVVARVYTSRRDLLIEEHKWLAQIKDEELGKKFYNMSKKHFGHWSCEEATRERVSKKLVGRTHSVDTRKMISENSKGRFWINNGIENKSLVAGSNIPEGWVRGRHFPQLIGRKRPAEVVAKYTASRKRGKGWSHSDDVRQRMAASHTGLKQSDSHKAAISLALKGKPSNNPRGRAAK